MKDFGNVIECSTVNLTDSLVPEADAEDAFRRPELANHLFHDASLVRDTGSRRKHDLIILLNLIHSDLVVAMDINRMA
jgi:hypothetical protein